MFCYATLLPIALRADSVDDFLTDTKVSEADLRDLCLQMEQPGLQQIRDACAYLTREDDEHDDAEMNDEEEPADLNTKGLREIRRGIRMFDPRIDKRGAFPEAWKPKPEDKLEPMGGVPSRRADTLIQMV